jgi:uncharacterized membrane protein YoaK (UPF0700 family)
VPINYSRRLTGRVRTLNANKHLGLTLAFVAGAINAGGYLAVQQYTSHMTGIVSSMADNLATGTFDAALAGLGALFAFIAGAGCSAILINLARQRNMHSEFALPLMVEAILLLVFGLIGARLATFGGLFVSLTVVLLAFIMGLQNAVISKLSNAEIRTTHVTGIVTDIGIELGKLIYRNADTHAEAMRVVANRPRLRLLLSLAGCFFVGGVTGAIGFQLMGYFATVPIALVLVALASVPVVDDLLAQWRDTR